MLATRMMRGTLRSGRAPVWAGMAAIVALGWLYMVHMNAGMAAMGGMAMPARGGIGALEATFVMWVVMMVAMMLPSIVPTVSVFAMLAGRRAPATAGRMTTVFVIGYSLAWIAFCVPASVAQWGLSRVALLSAMGESTSAMLSAAILVAAGLFQFSGMKNACVSKCRSPFAFLMHEWRDGAAGALLLGLRNGSNCVGCCWALMMVLFVVGTMNLLWMALFTLLVSGEKIVPARWRLDAIVGAGFIVWGAVLATGGVQ
jgi:predicted metal-binding membrane protein